ncbi:unnamed protein product [Brugia timori]|uniref:Uncharacterized protein n=1 Tax=Brugia timori TaxID=42155 RepID=A0A3P7U1F5_9BILA|nr:unnamed protein product [Brugia timori]
MFFYFLWFASMKHETMFNIRTVRSMDEFNANLNKHAVADS